jgi:hypothetical protein
MCGGLNLSPTKLYFSQVSYGFVGKATLFHSLQYLSVDPLLRPQFDILHAIYFLYKESSTFWKPDQPLYVAP